MAIEHDLEIIPVINKIDMPSAMPDEVEDEIVDLIGCKHEDILRASGKTGEGVEDILEAVVNRVPAPVGDESTASGFDFRLCIQLFPRHHRLFQDREWRDP